MYATHFEPNSNYALGRLLALAFATGHELGWVLNANERIEKVSAEQVVATARRHLTRAPAIAVLGDDPEGQSRLRRLGDFSLHPRPDVFEPR